LTVVLFGFQLTQKQLKADPERGLAPGG